MLFLIETLRRKTHSHHQFREPNATLNYCLKLARLGYKAVLDDPALNHGVNIHENQIVHPGVAEAVNAKGNPKLVTA